MEAFLIKQLGKKNFIHCSFFFSAAGVANLKSDIFLIFQFSYHKHIFSNFTRLVFFLATF